MKDLIINVIKKEYNTQTACLILIWFHIAARIMVSDNSSPEKTGQQMSFREGHIY